MRFSSVAAVGFSAAILTVIVGCTNNPEGAQTVPIGGSARRDNGRQSLSFSRRPSVMDHLVHSFGGVGDGTFPATKLLNFNGKLYGTTESGGKYGKGTMFAITPAGIETVLYSFGHKASDGAEPAAGVINVGSKLYGTTESGGKYGDGTVFRIAPSGTETVLYSFGGFSTDGSKPVAGLTNVNGTMYGTTLQGGAYGYGTVFTVTPSGHESVLYSFGRVFGDGAEPAARLINVNGILYGTTEDGGSGGSGCYTYTCGTVYSITTSGRETVLHSFANTPDGAFPQAELLNLNGTLYGTTYGGGLYHRGTVFSIDASGTESVVYSFQGDCSCAPNPNDAAEPASPLLNVSGTLYGTTTGGGVWPCPVADGACGTVFSISTSGSETVIYSFGGRGNLGHPDGSNPTAALIDVNGALYGTTYNGGAYQCRVRHSQPGCGTVFKITEMP